MGISALINKSHHSHYKNNFNKTKNIQSRPNFKIFSAWDYFYLKGRIERSPISLAASAIPNYTATVSSTVAPLENEAKITSDLQTQISLFCSVD